MVVAEEGGAVGTEVGAEAEEDESSLPLTCNQLLLEVASAGGTALHGEQHCKQTVLRPVMEFAAL